MSKVEQLLSIAQTLANDWPRFFERLGHGVGDRATNAFMAELRSRALRELGENYAEKCISGQNGLRVDYYFRDETTIVEVAMSLRNSNSEFERDILKAIMAQEANNPVTHLLFLAKPGARATCNHPARQSMIAWAQRNHGLTVEIREFGTVSELIVDPPDE